MGRRPWAIPARTVKEIVVVSIEVRLYGKMKVKARKQENLHFRGIELGGVKVLAVVVTSILEDGMLSSALRVFPKEGRRMRELLCQS